MKQRAVMLPVTGAAAPIKMASNRGPFRLLCTSAVFYFPASSVLDIFRVFRCIYFLELYVAHKQQANSCLIIHLLVLHMLLFFHVVQHSYIFK